MRTTDEGIARPTPYQTNGHREMASAESLPLEGIRVLDFTQVEFGPSATQVLGDFGAEVIKVERPGGGDIIRQVDHRAKAGGERSVYYLSLNRNKRSIAVDFSAREGQEVLASLATRSDVLVQNFRPGTLERYGLGYERLSALNPQLIYVAGTGFGEHGPLAHKGGQDLLAQSLSGIAMHNQDASGRPTLNAIAFADYCSGMVLVQGVLLALLHRGRTGLGQYVHVSLLDTMLAVQLQEYTQWLLHGVEGNFVSHYLAGVFRTADGWITIAGYFRPNPLQDLCDAFDIPDLSQRPEYANNEVRIRNREKLFSELEQLLRKFTTEECLQRLQAKGVLCAPVLGYPEVLSHPQVRENKMILELEHPTGSFKTIANPLKMSRAVRHNHQPPPLLGEHTDEVLQEAGYSPEYIANLRERQVLGSLPRRNQDGETQGPGKVV